MEGQDEAILEEIELREGEPQTFRDIGLKDCFNTTVVGESNMVAFKTCTQNFGKFEEKFMLNLAKLYKSTNPIDRKMTVEAAVKRKFYKVFHHLYTKTILWFATIYMI